MLKSLIVDGHFLTWLQHIRGKVSLRWCHNELYGVLNHLRLDCLLNRLFRHRSKKTSKLRITGFVKGIHRWPVNSPHKGPVTRKMSPFDDVMKLCLWLIKVKQMTAIMANVTIFICFAICHRKRACRILSCFITKPLWRITICTPS